jgi:hypothetical protein
MMADGSVLSFEDDDDDVVVFFLSFSLFFARQFNEKNKVLHNFNPKTKKVLHNFNPKKKKSCATSIQQKKKVLCNFN